MDVWKYWYLTRHPKTKFLAPEGQMQEMRDTDTRLRFRKKGKRERREKRQETGARIKGLWAASEERRQKWLVGSL